MPKLNPQQLKKISKISQVIDGGIVELAKYISDVEDKVVETNLSIKEVSESIPKSIKGDDGEDYELTQEDREEIAKNIYKDLNKDDLVDKVLNAVDYSKVASMVEKPSDGVSPTKKELTKLIKSLMPKERGVNTNNMVQEASKLALEGIKSSIPTIESIADKVPLIGGKIADSLETIKVEKEKLSIDAVAFLRKELDDVKGRHIPKFTPGGNIEILEDGVKKGLSKRINFGTGFDVGIDGNKIDITIDHSETSPTLQQVTDAGSTTTNDIEALSFTKTGGVSTEFLKANGSVDTHNYLLSESSGVITFAGFTIDTATTVDVGEVVAQFMDYTDPANPTSTTVTRSATTGETDPLVATANITYVLMNSSGTLIFQSSAPTAEDLATDKVFLGNLGHPDRATITTAFSFSANIQNPASQIREVLLGLGSVVKNGLTFSASATGMQVTRDAGTIIDLGIGSNGTEPYDTTPHTKDFAVLDPVTSFLYVASDGTNVGATVLDPDSYDPNGNIDNLATVSNNKFTVQYLVMFKGGFTNIQYGQTQYPTLDSALTAVVSGEDYTFAQVILDSAVIRTALIMKKGITGNIIDAVTAGTAMFHNFGKLGVTAGGGGGGSVAGTTLQDAYANSDDPEITTNGGGALSVKRGSALDTDNVFEGLNGAGTTTFGVDGNGQITATSFVKSGGASTEFLKANGTVDSSTYLTTGDATTTYVPYTGATSDVDLGSNSITAEKVLFNNWETQTLTGDAQTIAHNDYPTVFVDGSNTTGGTMVWNTAIADGSYNGQLLTIRIKLSTTDPGFAFPILKVILTSPKRTGYCPAVLFGSTTRTSIFDLMWNGTSWEATDGLSENDWTGGGGAWASGDGSIASGVSSHAEGTNTTASSTSCHAEGSGTTASGNGDHAEGSNTTANGGFSHSEGNGTTASGSASHAEGNGTTASSFQDHAEGLDTTASGQNSHAQGYNTIASGNTSHAGGDNTQATGLASFSHGKYVKTTGIGSAIFGYHASILQTFTDNQFFTLYGVDHWIATDNKKQYFGAGKDVSTTFDGSDWIFNSENVTANDEVHFTNFDRVTVDSTFKGGYESSDGSAGITTTQTVVTDMRDNAGQMEKKTQLNTYKDGLLTAKGTESAWTATTDI